MSVGRDPVDRVLEAAMFAPIGAAIVARDASKLAVRTGFRLSAMLASRLAIHAVDLLTVDAEVERLNSDDHSANTTTQPPLQVEPLAAVEDEGIPAKKPPDEGTLVSVDQLAIEGYGHLAARQIVQRLEMLTPNELALILAYETSHRHRQTVLGRIRQLSSA